LYLSGYYIIWDKQFWGKIACSRKEIK